MQNQKLQRNVKNTQEERHNWLEGVKEELEAFNKREVWKIRKIKAYQKEEN